eukprot:s5865_g1.t1
MLWSERDAFGVPSWIQDSQLHCEAADGDLVKPHRAMLNLAALCLDNVVQCQRLEVKAAGSACSEGSPRKRVASAGGQTFLHAAPIREQTVLGLCGGQNLANDGKDAAWSSIVQVRPGATLCRSFLTWPRAPSLPDIVQEDTAMEANVLQAGKPSVSAATPEHD